MATHDEMTELFGADRVVTLDRSAAEERGLSEADAEVLCDVGVPKFVDVLFTLDTADGGPIPSPWYQWPRAGRRHASSCWADPPTPPPRVDRPLLAEPGAHGVRVADEVRAEHHGFSRRGWHRLTAFRRVSLLRRAVCRAVSGEACPDGFPKWIRSA
jgi:hypothetical protein